MHLYTPRKLIYSLHRINEFELIETHHESKAADESCFSA